MMIRFFSILVILSWGSLSLAKYQDHLEFSFVAMGTIWKVSIGKHQKSFDTTHVKHHIIACATKYDQTFSSWSSQSELRHYETIGMARLLYPSNLFLKALRVSKKAYILTDTVFDITFLGKKSTFFKESSLMDSLVFSETGNGFYFQLPVTSLVFDGLVKGMSLGEISTWLQDVGLVHFVINAGNGNIALSGRDKEQLTRRAVSQQEMQEVYFVSNSYTLQSHPKQSIQHIQNPKDPSLPLLSQTQLFCKGDRSNKTTWYEIGGLSDALSTAISIDPTITLPSYCYKN